jgi:hypothetical protein
MHLEAQPEMVGDTAISVGKSLHPRAIGFRHFLRKGPPQKTGLTVDGGRACFLANLLT